MEEGAREEVEGGKRHVDRREEDEEDWDPLRLFLETSQSTPTPRREVRVQEEVADERQRRPPEEEAKLHHDGSFGAYMQLKVRKLDEQFAEGTALAVVDDPTLAHLFEGVAIHVNGLTDPSHAELRRLMYMHGGSFQNYYHRSSVTHIICSNLPDAKVKAFEKERNPTPFVRPEWITESIRAKRLLPVGPYVLERTRPGGPGQRTLAFGSAGGGDTGRRQRLVRAQAIAKRLREECHLLKGPPKSSRDDPNFVESFYRASRLHFIGSWKTRLEKLMQSGVVDDSPVPTDGGDANAQGFKGRTVVHVDMDCFFASVAESSRPEFHGLPLAVCHSAAKGSGEISSANYEARKYGVHASMFMARAKELCPDLIVVPYEFEKYEAVSEAVFRIFLRYTSAVQAVSCDEAYLDVTGLGDPMDLVARMRRDIQSETSCRASAGVGPNMLLARLATAKAKPDGQYHMKVESALGELAGLDVQELPGIGWRTGEKLRQAGFHSVSDIQNSSKASLQGLIGEKAGGLAYDFAFGIDKRVVTPSTGAGTERKSVGAEVNWGVRFDSDADSETFLMSIAQQVGDRLTQLGMRGSSVTLKIKKRREGAQEPRKFLGMGICDSLTRSAAVDRVQSAVSIFEHALPLLRSLRLPFADIRGMGLSVTKLETTAAMTEARARARTRTNTSPRNDSKARKRGPSGHTPSRDTNKKMQRIDVFARPVVLGGPMGRDEGQGDEKRASSSATAAPNRLQPNDIDASVLSELPADLQREIRLEYGLAMTTASAAGGPAARARLAPVFAKQTKQGKQSNQKPNLASATNNARTVAPRPLLTEYDPMRMSQVDVDVLRELPAELQQEVTRSFDAYGKGFKLRKLAEPPRATVAASQGSAAVRRQARRELDRRISSLRHKLRPILQEAMDALLVGSSTAFVAKVATWLSYDTGDGDHQLDSDEHVRQIAELLIAEIESPAARIKETAAWSLARGLARLGSSSPAVRPLASAAAEALARKHAILLPSNE